MNNRYISDCGTIGQSLIIELTLNEVLVKIGKNGNFFQFYWFKGTAQERDRPVTHRQE